MAPPSDDDDDNYSGYDDDDVTEPEEEEQQRQRGRLSSDLQLLRVSFSSSTTPSNTSTGTSIGPASFPRNARLTPPGGRGGNAMQLNNGWSGRGREEFRPCGLNGRGGMEARQPNGSGQRSCARSSVQRRQQLALFDLVRTHRLFALTLEVRPNNGHHIRGPPFQVSSRGVSL